MLFVPSNVVKGQAAGGSATSPVGKYFAVIVHLDFQHLVSIQPAGDGPPKYLGKKKKKRFESVNCRFELKFSFVRTKGESP